MHVIHLDGSSPSSRRVAAGKVNNNNNKQEEEGLTVASPDLGQVAAALSRLLAELHHIAARGLGRDGDLSHGLLAVAEVHRQDHLEEEEEERVRA